MPFVIYVFTLCAFALGFTEFVTIGLVSTISADLHASVSQVGTAVTAYALGAVIGAPGLTALATHWPRKRLLLLAMALFTLGNMAVSQSNALTPMLIARFASGLGHGVFLSESNSSLLMLGYGVMAAIGNVWGGRLADRRGADFAVMIVLTGLTTVLLLVWFSASSLPLMVLLTGLLGALTYAAVPALQARVIGLSHVHAPQAPAVAAGLNIAGFNGGIALGSLLGGASLEAMGLTSTAWVGAIAVGLGIVWMLWQMRKASAYRVELSG